MYNNTSSCTRYIGQSPPFPVVRLHGLLFDCSVADIAEFLHGLDIVDVLLVHKGGRFSGEAYCVMGYHMQIDFALQRNRQNIGRRYVEVSPSKRHECYKVIAHEASDARSGSHRGSGAKSHDEGKDLLEHMGVLRLRGLPYSAKEEDIKDFFKDFLLVDDVIHVTYTSGGRSSGESFVEFANAEDSRSAMGKDKMTLGSRYVELFLATREAVAKGRPNSDDDQNEPVKHTGILRLSGLPYSATEEHILEFFNGFVLSEDSIHDKYTRGGRPAGEAFVQFASPEDSEVAMGKDRKILGKRYVELFPSSEQELNEAHQ